MARITATSDTPSTGLAVITAAVEAQGTGASQFAHGLTTPAAASRDLSDAVYSLCALHGRVPGVIDHVLADPSGLPVDAWVADAAEAFAIERGYLIQLTAAVGPLPSTPGQAESEAAIAVQRHALDMLARSERSGCAIGAAMALVLDWQAIRLILDAAARRFGMTPDPCRLPEPGHAGDASAAQARAMAFGAHQLLAQHHGLWQLLETRASARDEA